MQHHSHPWVVLKFGGTSVASVEAWAQIARIVATRRKQGKRVLVVHSAVSGISNRLEKIAQTRSRTDHRFAVAEIIRVHKELAQHLEVDADSLLSGLWQELHDLAAGIGLLGEASAKAHARLMALGELMATRLGAAYLAAQQQPVHWLDARTVLQSQAAPATTEAQQLLSAQCEFDHDPVLCQHFEQLPEIVLTQGFIARNEHGDTVLLGRGGSDTSASYFGARLKAERVEIWTDVPGMFTANPREIPDARLLKALSYDEAQEIAAAGAKVLHPRCIAPVRQAQIPMWVMCTHSPDLPGTVISLDAPKKMQIKAIAVKKDVTVISMETTGMWQQVGFLADVFNCFKLLGLSIDLVSTSESMVTVTLDPGANAISDATLSALTQSLIPWCKASVRKKCAAVSVVGRDLRRLLPQLKPMLDLLAEHDIHLLTQAANDLNFSVVVDQEYADNMARKIHEWVIKDEGLILGARWIDLSA